MTKISYKELSYCSFRAQIEFCAKSLIQSTITCNTAYMISKSKFIDHTFEFPKSDFLKSTTNQPLNRNKVRK